MSQTQMTQATSLRGSIASPSNTALSYVLPTPTILTNCATVTPDATPTATALVGPPPIETENLLDGPTLRVGHVYKLLGSHGRHAAEAVMQLLLRMNEYAFDRRRGRKHICGIVVVVE